MKHVNSLACIDTSLFMQVRKVLSAAKDGVEEGIVQATSLLLQTDYKQPDFKLPDIQGLAAWLMQEQDRVAELAHYN